MLTQEARAGPASAHASPSFHFFTFGKAPWRDGGAFGMSAMYYWQSLLLSWLDWAAACIMGPGVWFVNQEKKKNHNKEILGSSVLHHTWLEFSHFLFNFLFVDAICQALQWLDVTWVSFFISFFLAAAKTNLASSPCLWVPWVRIRRLSTGNFSASTWLTLQTSSLSHPTFATGVRNPNKERLSN